MGEEKKWYRVIDPLNPLFGCDVRCRKSDLQVNADRFVIEAMRRVDLLVGDRPFQLIAPEGEDLGLTIKRTHVEESPLQEETIEIGTDRPFGLCLGEAEVSVPSGHAMRTAQYERVTQVALEDPEGRLLATATVSHKMADVWLQAFVDEDGLELDELIAQMSRRA